MHKNGKSKTSPEPIDKAFVVWPSLIYWSIFYSSFFNMNTACCQEASWFTFNEHWWWFVSKAQRDDYYNCHLRHCYYKQCGINSIIAGYIIRRTRTSEFKYYRSWNEAQRLLLRPARDINNMPFVVSVDGKMANTSEWWCGATITERAVHNIAHCSLLITLVKQRNRLKESRTKLRRTLKQFDWKKHLSLTYHCLLYTSHCCIHITINPFFLLGTTTMSCVDRNHPTVAVESANRSTCTCTYFYIVSYRPYSYRLCSNRL
jgi:hypothetical protein